VLIDKKMPQGKKNIVYQKNINTFALELNVKKNDE